MSNNSENGMGIVPFVLLIIMSVVAFFVVCFVFVHCFIDEVISRESTEDEQQPVYIPPPPPPRKQPVFIPPPPPPGFSSEEYAAFKVIHNILGEKCEGMDYADAIRACEKITHPDHGGKHSDFIEVQKARKVLLG